MNLGLRTCIAERDRLQAEVDELRALLAELGADVDVVDLRDRECHTPAVVSE